MFDKKFWQKYTGELDIDVTSILTPDMGEMFSVTSPEDQTQQWKINAIAADDELWFIVGCKWNQGFDNLGEVTCYYNAERFNDPTYKGFKTLPSFKELMSSVAE